jgi:hypothetical protein
MKKYFYLFLSLFSVILLSCNQNNPSDPTNPSNPTNPSDTTNPSNPSDVNKVKYLKESASWYTFQDTESGTNWGTGLNVVSKYVYERGSEAKYIKSQSNYNSDELVMKRTYQNESDRDYSWVSYPSGTEVSSRDTTIWYDDARSKQKETRTSTSISIYEYDSQHHDRQVSTKNYYQSGVMWAESYYTYNGLTRKGETKFYTNGKLSSIQKSTDEFMDDTFTRLKSMDTETFTYISETESYRSNTSKSRYEWDDKLWTKTTTDYETFDQSGNRIQTSKYAITYTWQDELNNTSEVEYYLNGSLWYRQSGYNKYTY